MSHLEGLGTSLVYLCRGRRNGRLDGGEEGEPLSESQQCPWLLKATRGWLGWWFFCHTLCFPFPLPRPKLGCCFSSKLVSSPLPPQKTPQPKLLEEKHRRPPQPAMRFKQGRVRKPEPANIVMPGAHSWGHTRTAGGTHAHLGAAPAFPPRLVPLSAGPAPRAGAVTAFPPVPAVSPREQEGGGSRTAPPRGVRAAADPMSTGGRRGEPRNAGAEDERAAAPGRRGRAGQSPRAPSRFPPSPFLVLPSRLYLNSAVHLEQLPAGTSNIPHIDPV